MRRFLSFMSVVTILAVLLGSSTDALAEEAEQRSDGSAPAETSDGGDAADEDSDLPLAAARRRFHVEPLGDAPSPWGALSGRIDGGVHVDGSEGWSALRFHIPVARRYGVIDARLIGQFDQDGLVSLGPELVLRGTPLRLAGGRGSLGFSFTFAPLMVDYEPLITLGGGLMGGYLGEHWFSWAHVGVLGEVVQRGRPELQATIAAGLRLRYGLRPQLEVELRSELHEYGETRLIVRPGFRYWPAEFVGIGIAADIWVLGEDIEMSSIRFDVIGHAME